MLLTSRSLEFQSLSSSSLCQTQFMALKSMVKLPFVWFRTSTRVLPPSLVVAKKVEKMFERDGSSNFSPSAMQTLGEMMLWVQTKEAKVEVERRLRHSGICERTRRETIDFAIRVLQNKFGSNSISSCALAACFLSPCQSQKFRRGLFRASEEVCKSNSSWISRNFPSVVFGDATETYRNIVVEILSSQNSRKLDEKVAFWAPPALV
ncbi:hypothetical protein GMAR_ORF45 [Golden Marseillevirus]|uniref:hypothetical protein n=1 Tax=Golden Marseillevirus TaxID=1720526 RepID=UPI000877AD1B|nr:hypothetical protein GMAR_ORF45 [Golden Marseillevirus]ALX27420.1 hypothetical protein GMAR_ORF45 [Golden Marseillevirus]